MNKHLKEVGESYWTHFRFSLAVSIALTILSGAALVHAILPNLLTTTVTTELRRILQIVNQRKDTARLKR